MAGLRLSPVLALVAFGFLGSALMGKSPADCGASTACMTDCCEDTTECCCGTDATEAAGCEEGPCLGRGGSELPLHASVDRAPLPYPPDAIGLDWADWSEQVLYVAGSDDSWSSRRPAPERAPPRA